MKTYRKELWFETSQRREPIGKETAKRLAAVLNCDYRRFL